MTWEQVLGEVLPSVLSAAIVGAGALLVEPIRTFFRYRSHEYFLWHSSTDTRCTWDIQWEGTRLRIDAENVHNDHLEKAYLTLNEGNREDLGDWFVSSEFLPDNKWPTKIKLAAIIRKKTGDQRIYNVHFVVRRSRWSAV